MLEKILSRLGLDELEVKVYLSLIENGPQVAGALAKREGIVRVTAYIVLVRLLEKGFVTQSRQNGVKLFGAEEPEKIGLLLEERAKALDDDRKTFKQLLPQIKEKQSRITGPKFQVFEGAEGLKNILKDMLLYKNIETQAYWPIKTMIQTLSPEFFRYHNKERIKNHLYTRAIWPKDEVVDIGKHPYLGVGKEFEREIRIAPNEIDFSMGYWIYGNKVAFLSSRRESMGFIVESAELVEMLLSQFEVIWKMSKTLKVHPEDTRAFVEELSGR